MTYKSENEKRELKRKTLKKQIHQHNLTLWKALNLSYQQEEEPNYEQNLAIEHELKEKFQTISFESAASPSTKILESYQSLFHAYIPKEKQKNEKNYGVLQDITIHVIKMI